MKSGSRSLSVLALVGVLTFALVGCGEESEAPDEGHDNGHVSATPLADVTAPPPDDAKVIGVTITADSVSPDGDRISVERNQPVVLEIDAAGEGELHVHSTPEETVAYPAGKSQVQLEFDKAGVVDVEDHGLDMLIVQLEVE
jgi:hypothetical protein